MTMQEIPGSNFQIKADLVLLAMGFLGPRTEGLLAQSGVAMTPRGAVAADFGAHQTSAERIFACGDMRRGQSLVVWAIREGRECAQAVDAWLATHATVR
jgi:glutamate synthase (NADPH/NADH) small chain